MKTPEQILKKCCTDNDDPYLMLNTAEMAMKEYAKQWIDRVAEVVLMDEEMRGFDGVIVKADSHKEYKFNSQRFKYTLTIDKDSILDLKKEIDAQ